MRSPPLPPPAPASLILPAIFWGQNYVPVRPYALIFFGFSFFIKFLDLFFLLFSYFSSLLFNFPYPSLLSNPSLLISSYSYRRYYSSSSYSSLLIL
jgi:hypothetical protein